MDSNERYALFQAMVDEYRALFADMNDEARAAWFTAMDESDIVNDDVGRSEFPTQAQERHMVKLHAIAAALRSLPCAEIESARIADLYRARLDMEQQRYAARQPATDVTAVSSFSAGSETEDAEHAAWRRALGKRMVEASKRMETDPEYRRLIQSVIR